MRPRVEVINLGIPHLRSNHVLALFLAEALPLGPDVITYYQGSNDNLPDDTDTFVGRGDTSHVWQSAHNHVLTVALIDDFLARFARPGVFRQTSARSGRAVTRAVHSQRVARSP